MPTISGFTTVADLVDGQTGATIVFSNESHVFVASADGEITVGNTGRNLPDYANTVVIYSGTDAVNYANLATPTANNTWTVAGSADVGGQTYRTLALSNNLQLRIADTTGIMTVHDLNTASDGFVDASGPDSVVLTVPVTVRVAGVNITYNRSISFAKALGGSAPFIRMETTGQTVAYPFGSATPTVGQDAITFTANSFNFSGTPAGVWSYTRVGGTASSGTITDSASTDIDGASTDASTLVLTTTAYNTHLGNGRAVTYRFQRTSQGAGTASADQISVVKLTDADAGGAVVIAVAAGNNILKNNPVYSASDATTYVDLEAQLYVGGNRVNDTFFTTGISRGTITFVWSKNGVAIPASGAGSLQVSQPSNYGRTSYRIRVGGADVADGGSESYSCAITYT